MRKITIIFSILLLSTKVWGWTYTADMKSYPNIGSSFSCVDRSSGYGSIESTSGTPDSPTAMKLHWNGGSDNGSEAAHCWDMLPSIANQIYFTYYFKYGSNFSWHPVYNKHIYFYESTNQTKPKPRMTFGVRGGGGQMVAVGASATYGLPYMHPNTGNDVPINKGQWYKVSGRINFGTPGGYNGSFDIWVNDIKIMSYKNVPILVPGDSGVNEFSITPVWGGYVTGLLVPSSGMDMWFGKTVISTDLISGIENPLPDKIPNSPSNLRIQ